MREVPQCMDGLDEMSQTSRLSPAQMDRDDDAPRQSSWRTELFGVVPT